MAASRRRRQRPRRGGVEPAPGRSPGPCRRRTRGTDHARCPRRHRGGSRGHRAFPRPRREPWDRALAVGLDQTLSDGVFHQLGAVVHVKLFHDVVAVGLDGLDTQEQRVGDLAVGLAFGHQAQDLALAIAERLERFFLWRALKIIRDQQPRHRGIEIWHALAGRLDGGDQVRSGGLLENVSDGAGLQGLEKIFLVVMRSENQHLGLRAKAANLARHLDARHVRHGYIDDRDVWAVGPRQSDGLPTLGGFSDHLDIALPVDYRADPGAYEVMVLDQHHTDGAALNRHGYPPAEVWRRLRCP